MKDLEGNHIQLNLERRAHTLILGSTGSGKTWLSFRMLEEAVRENKKVFIVDFSNSFSDDEIAKNQLNCVEDLSVFDLKCQQFVWQYKAETKDEYVDALANCLQKALEINGCLQGVALYEVLVAYMEDKTEFDLSGFIGFINKTIKGIVKSDSKVEVTEHLQKVYQKLQTLKKLEKFLVKWYSEECTVEKGVVLQLGRMTQFQKEFMTRFLLEIYWSEVVSGFGKYEVLIVDEIQHLSLNGEGAFAQILAEGRKTDIKGVFTTQFLKCKNPDARRTILQAGQIFLFRMNHDDVKHWAGSVCEDDLREGKRILNSLRCGEAILLGEYCLNGSNRLATKPIICKT